VDRVSEHRGRSEGAGGVVSATSKSTASRTRAQRESSWKARICSASWFSIPHRLP
jgi:hypothetical protein